MDEAVTRPPGNTWLRPVEDAWADQPNVLPPPPPPPPPPPGGGGGQQPAATPPPNVYADVGEWVTKWLSPMYRRYVTDSQVWCAWWFRHGEAVYRLEGAWRAWEQLTREEQWGGDEWFGISIWWNVHGDPCMDRLLSLNGPFQMCTRGRHSDDLAPLPVAEYEPGLFAP